MTTLTIDGKNVSTPPGSTILAAATSAGIEIPTLCYLEGFDHFTSCMVCVVKDVKTGRLLPSCSTPVADGMELESSSDEVHEARRETLELLLSEHVGDCEGPCQRACPARMNIPLMIRQIRDRQLPAAAATIRKDIALPAVLGRICPAPCEKACRRRQQDDPVSICLLKRFAADETLREPPPGGDVPTPSGKEVAIIGAGPAGLAAALYLSEAGHGCTLFDDHPEPGGMLRYGVPDKDLPKDVLNNEIQAISGPGVHFRLSCRVGKDITAEKILADYDAVIIAAGSGDAEKNTLAPHLVELAGPFGIDTTEIGLAVDKHTFQTKHDKVFAGGNAIHHSHMAVWAVAHGKSMAESVSQFLAGDPPEGSSHRFNSIFGRMKDGDIQEFMKDAETRQRTKARSRQKGFTEDEARREAERCMHCDCRKPQACKLRALSEDYGAKQHHYRGEDRLPFEKIQQHSNVIYEPGKCIKCGICVRLCEKAGEAFGLAFIGRGFTARVAVPLNRSLEEALAKTAKDCVVRCPTGALAVCEKRRE